MAATDLAAEAAQYDSPTSMISGKMGDLVKGKGFIGAGNVHPTQDPREILADSMKAEMAIKAATKRGEADPQAVFKGLNPAFTTQFGSFLQNSPGVGAQLAMRKEIEAAFADLGKNVTLTSPLSTGFVPYDLSAPSRLIYPVYSPLRNKIPRVPGQGTSKRSKIISQISGSLGGRAATGLGFKRTGVGEGNLSAYPESSNIGNTGAQLAYDLNVPYFFNQMSEGLSWLAQFGGQGFEDASSLTNLILLQEMMLAEEGLDIASTSIALGTPAAPTLVTDTAGSISGFTASYYAFAYVTQTNYYGETVASAVTALGQASAGGVLTGITLSTTLLPGAQQWNVYLAQASTNTAPGSTASHKFATGIGGANYTLNGVYSAAAAVPPVSDTGTYDSAGLNQEGLLSVLSGHTGSTLAPSAQYAPGFYNGAVGDTLNVNVVNNALLGLWDSSNTSGTGLGFNADPAELICSGFDATNLSASLTTNSSTNAYRIFLTPNDQTGAREGAAVSEVVNPVTRNLVKIMVHPAFTQGTAILMSYTLPFSFSNVSNVVEKTVVQDYLSVSWPVIDPSFRYSIFWYGALTVNAPQYCGLLQGLQRTDGTGSTAWS